MNILTASKLQALSVEKKRQFEGLLPEIIKRLIIAGTSDLSSLRIPSGDDIWASGFDGVVSCATANTYVAEGTSVWEFGTSNEPLKKINSDYIKRTNNPLGLDISKTTFYMVIPKIWAYKEAITQWEAEHADWKAVHVYDASVLCDWINSEPTVVSWLFEELWGRYLDFFNVKQAWDLFSQKTNPALCQELFLENRESYIKSLNELLNQQKSPKIKVQSDSFIDSIGFVLGALAQNHEIHEKCIVVNDVNTYKTISNSIKKKIIILNYFCNHDILPSENIVIVCYSKESSIRSDIQLKPYSKMHYINAFRIMGMNEIEAYELYEFCHGNLRALIRRIPGLANENMPEWAKIEEKRLLEPILYFRAINKNRDKELVEIITKTNYETVENFYNTLLKNEDSPIKKVEDNYIIVNYEEAWNVFGYSVDDSPFDRFHTIVIWYLNSLGKYELNTGIFKQHTIEKRVENLLTNYVYYSFSSDESDKLSEKVNEILQYAFDDRVSGLLIKNMAVLAEASPQTVLNFLEHDLKDENSRLLALFNSVDQPREYFGLLSALDELTLHRQTSVNTCKLLFSLYQKVYEYKIQNSPLETLLKALWLFNSEVALTTQQKKELISFFYKNDAFHACELICKLLEKESFTKSVRYGEHRNDAQNQLTVQEVIESIEFIARIVFEHCNTSGNISFLQSLLTQYRRFRPKFLEDRCCQFSLKAFNNKDLTPVVFQLKEQIYSIQKYQLVGMIPYLSVLKSWANLLLSGCPEEERDDWMFYQTHECPSELLLEYNDDNVEIKKQERRIRIEKLNDIMQNIGIKGIIRLTKRMEDNSYWGWVLSEIINDVSLRELIENLAEDGKFAIIGGMMNTTSLYKAETIYSLIPCELQLRLLSFVYRNDFWKILKTEEEKKEYWNHQYMIPYNEEIYAQLLIYNPRGLLNYFYKKMGKDTQLNIDEIKNIIISIASDKFDFSFRVNEDKFFITEIVKKIDSISYDDEWALTCIDLYNKGFLQEMPLSGKIFFFNHPHIFVDYVSEAHLRYSLDFSLPPNACREYDKLISFISALINSNKMYLAADIVANMPEGENGVRLSQTTCELLEHVNDKEFDNILICSVINTNGFRFITDGTDRKALSIKYENDASELEILYPHAANVLRELSKFYRAEGKRDYVFSELNDY